MFLRSLLLVASILVLAGCQTASGPNRATAMAVDYRENASDSRRAVIVVDADSGRTLYSDSADQPRYPASMAKMMTLYILFEEMQSGRIGPDTLLSVSAAAAAKPPSKLGLKAGSAIRVDDAVHVIAVKSANDLAAVIAENIAGSEEAFADRMTRTARAIGMRSTTFRNASGLPDPEQVTTARDMAVLLRALRTRFPERSSVLGLRSFAYAGRTFTSTNHMLGELPGMEAGKTGYTAASGFNLATSVSRGGHRLIVVVMGEPTSAARSAHVTALVDRYLPERTGLLAYR